MSQHLVGLAEVAQFLGIVFRGRRPGNRLWELMRAGRVKRQAGAGSIHSRDRARATRAGGAILRPEPS
jgi:hypothetical protein